jgi:hypothetical protein
MPIDPWSYADKTKTEHAEQTALFMWAAMGYRYGLQIANDSDAYSVKNYAEGFSIRLGGDAYALPQLKWLHAIHNQGHGDKVRGSIAKAEGVKAGVFDIFLPVPTSKRNIIQVNGWFHYHGLYIELKRKGAGKPSQEQLDFLADMRQAGYSAYICHGWEAARDCILEYLNVN